MGVERGPQHAPPFEQAKLKLAFNKTYEYSSKENSMFKCSGSLQAVHGYFDSSKRHSFEVGRRSVELSVLTLAVQTKPSVPGITLVTLPNSH